VEDVEMKRLCVVVVLLMLAVPAFATGPVQGDSIFLFNGGSTGSPFGGYWLTAANDGAGTFPLTSWTPFNDGALTPTPNNPLVGDVNGDGVSDIVTQGTNANGHSIMLGRNTAATAGVGDLFAAPVGSVGWDQNWSPRWDTTVNGALLADVNGDGKADAVTSIPSLANPTFLEVQAAHSDADGLEGNAPAVTNTWFEPMGSSSGLLLAGDFNGNGAGDILMQNPVDNFIVGIVSTPGSGLNGGNGTFWGGIGIATNHIATLVGDIDGDGKDDIVQVDDRNSDGYWTWVAGLTGADATPAGIGIGTGGLSWASPFGLDTASIAATPLLVDINNDGYDDLVLYEEYTFDDGSGARTWGRLLAAYNNGGTIQDIPFAESTVFDYSTLFGVPVNIDGFVPMFGNIHACFVEGDLDGDCVVNLSDFAKMADNWLRDETP